MTADNGGQIKAVKMLVDSNIIIYYLNGEEKAVDFIEVYHHQLAISIISYSEILSPKLSDEAFEELCLILTNNFEILPLNIQIAQTAAKLRQQNKIKLPDALIAASALTYDLPLVTRNVKDFNDLSIRILNPMDEDEP